MEIFNQLLVRAPKWIVSWILVILDAFAGYFVIDLILYQFEISYPVFKIYLVLQITMCLLFWSASLYKGDAQTSRFVETENLIKITFFMMAAASVFIGSRCRSRSDKITIYN